MRPSGLGDGTLTPPPLYDFVKLLYRPIAEAEGSKDLRTYLPLLPPPPTTCSFPILCMEADLIINLAKALGFCGSVVESVSRGGLWESGIEVKEGLRGGSMLEVIGKCLRLKLKSRFYKFLL